ncbi:MAG: MarR family winged helix-turn-helix transcriptional regulator [Pseudomonadota bacterium]
MTTMSQEESEALEPFGDPLQSFGHLARLTFRAFARTLEQRILPHGITIGQWRFLRELWRGDGITQRELSERLSMREPSTVGAVRSLESAGLVRRVRDGYDRRKIRVYLTPRARSLRDPLLRHVRDVNVMATKGIPGEDLETARRVLLQLMTNLESAHGADGPPLSEVEEV